MSMNRLFFDSKIKRSGKVSYMAPRIMTEAEALLEQALLASSIYQRSAIETAGQENAGYFENGEIVSTDNYWGD
jgi:hypothetical protein